MSFSIRRSSVLIFFSIFLIGAVRARAQDASAQIVRLNGRTARLRPDAAAWLDSFRHAANEPSLAVLSFGAILDEAARTSLAAAGIRIHSFLSPAMVIASIAPGVNPDVAGIRGIVPVNPAMKMLPALEAAAKAAVSVDLLISCVPGTTPTEVSARVIAAGGQMRSTPLEEHAFFEITLPGDRMELLAKWPAVLSIGPAAKDVPLNLESQRATKVNVVHAPVSLADTVCSETALRSAWAMHLARFITLTRATV